MIPKVVSGYRFTALPDPDAVRLWQRALALARGLTGRILIAREGINLAMSGPVEDLKAHLKDTREHPALHDLTVTWTDGTGADHRRLRVLVRPELVTFGVGPIRLDGDQVAGTAPRLTPDQLDAMAADREDLVLLDGRNAWEASIGRFRGAVVPPVERTSDFLRLLDSGELDHLKDRPVVAYCTGGIRCEVLSALMLDRGFGEVYQLDGGILRYGRSRGDDGLWEGSLHVFDERGAITFSDHPAVLAECSTCGAPADVVRDCGVDGCRGRDAGCATCPPRCAEHR